MGHQHARVVVAVDDGQGASPLPCLVHHPGVSREKEFPKLLGADERAVPGGHVFPPAQVVQRDIGGELPYLLDAKIGPRFDHTLHEGGIVVDAEGEVFEAHPVAQLALAGC
jgi:hypothetical protein